MELKIDIEENEFSEVSREADSEDYYLCGRIYEDIEVLFELFIRPTVNSPGETACYIGPHPYKGVSNGCFKNPEQAKAEFAIIIGREFQDIVYCRLNKRTNKDLYTKITKRMSTKNEKFGGE